MMTPPVRHQSYRIAIAGLGRAAREIHIPALSKLERFEIVGGADPAAPNADFGFPLFPDLPSLLRATSPDIVVVATPPDSHYALVREALEAGAHVLCEKPFMPSLEEADAIVVLARERSLRVVVNNQYRFMNVHRRARELIGSAQFGELQFLSMTQTFRVSPATEAGWRGAEMRRTGQEFGTHALDLCRYFFGEDPAWIRCRMPRPGAGDGPDYLNLVELEFGGDRVAAITLDRLCRGRHRYLDIRLDGTLGCIETHIGGGIELRLGIQGGTRRPFAKLDIALGGSADLWHGEAARRIATDPLDLLANATRNLLREFIAALDTGRTPPCDAADNRRSLALMLAAYESQATGRAIELRNL
ncbi:MAG TPA: Gfo/Idh/MocA family oxidoreductase [Casimicrobiaceae bacterium]